VTAIKTYPRTRREPYTPKESCTRYGRREPYIPKEGCTRYKRSEKNDTQTQKKKSNPKNKDKEER
jgi:hypothetical protein